MKHNTNSSRYQLAIGGNNVKTVGIYIIDSIFINIYISTNTYFIQNIFQEIYLYCALPNQKQFKGEIDGKITNLYYLIIISFTYPH